jgi:hypothetical protein
MKAKTTKGSKMKTIKEITELAKSLTPTIVKFTTEHQAAYAMAIQGLTQLIAIEATEQAAGSDESYDISTLSNSLDYLKSWAWSEEYEASIEDANDSNLIELSATADLSKSDTVEVAPVEVAPVEVAPVEVAPVEVAVELTQISESEEVANTIPEISGETDVKTLVEEAVKSALGEMKSSIVAQFESVIKTVESDNTKLKSELETALNKVVGGGAKRTATKMSEKSQNDNLVKADEYEMKAAATTDRKAAEGYRQIAKELRSESKSN